MEIISKRVYARVGLLGNPSDGYSGCCLSCLVSCFSAVVTLQPSNVGISYTPSPVHDGLDYDRGGVRILESMTKCFFQHCQTHEIYLDTSLGFDLSYETSIPREVGLSGSSAICTATLNCLSDFYGVKEKISIEERPELVRSAETALGIACGLQDRVVQVYGGLTWMDFSVEPHVYKRLRGPDLSFFSSYLEQRLFVMYSEDLGSDSGKIHSDVKHRWEAGDEDVRQGMAELAGLARRGHCLLREGQGSPEERPFDLGTGVPLGPAAFSLLGFGMGILWIDALAGEVVGILSLVAKLAGLPSSLIGLTLLAWGGSGQAGGLACYSRANSPLVLRQLAE